MKLAGFILVVCLAYLGQAPVVAATDEAIVQRLDRIERLLQSQGLLDMLQQIETLQRELSNLQGDIEYQNHTLEQMKKRQRDLYTDIDQRLQKLERGVGTQAGVSLADEINLVEIDDNAPPLQTIEAVGDALATAESSQQAESSLVVEVVENNTQQQAAVQEIVQETASPGPVEEVEATVEQADQEILVPAEQLDPVQIRAQYQQAFKLLKRSQYDQAIKAFSEFLLVNPQSEYSDNAQYWLGEAYYANRQFEQALTEYNKLLKNYPESKKYTHSLLKIGFCYFEMGALDQAVNRLQHLKQEFPDTTAARLADERLKKIARASTQSENAGE